MLTFLVFNQRHVEFSGNVLGYLPKVFFDFSSLFSSENSNVFPVAVKKSASQSQYDRNQNDHSNDQGRFCRNRNTITRIVKVSVLLALAQALAAILIPKPSWTIVTSVFSIFIFANARALVFPKYLTRRTRLRRFRTPALATLVLFNRDCGTFMWNESGWVSIRKKQNWNCFSYDARISGDTGFVPKGTRRN